MKVEKYKMSIAFLGDSITLGYGLDNMESRYSTIVSRELGMEEENYGITGTLIAKAGLNSDDKNDFLSRADLITKADVAVVFGGTNDYFWSDKPIYGDDGSYFEHAVKELVDLVKEKRKARITLFVTPYAHNGIGNFKGGRNWQDSNRHDTSEINFNGHTLRDYVNVIENVCAENDIYCLNLHKEFDFCWQKHTLDGCHPNEKGHALIANAIVKRLKFILALNKI